MGATTIAWCDHSINPIRAEDQRTGRVGHYCEKLSAGCQNCYSSRLQTRFGMPSFQEQRTDAHIVPFLDCAKLQDVIHRKKPTKYFWCDMTDMFGEWVPSEWIDQCFAAMMASPQHIHMVLTKRPGRMRDWLTTFNKTMGGPRSFLQHILGLIPPARRDDVPAWPVPNIWLGTSVENQVTADARIPLLLQTPAAVHFVSYEPALGSVDFRPYLPNALWNDLPSWAEPELAWVIVGGESGPKARPCNLAWLRQTVEQCQQAQVACFVKQLGARPWFTGLTPHGDGWPAHIFSRTDTTGGQAYELHGFNSKASADPEEWAHEFRIQEFPATARSA